MLPVFPGPVVQGNWVEIGEQVVLEVVFRFQVLPSCFSVTGSSSLVRREDLVLPRLRVLFVGTGRVQENGGRVEFVRSFGVGVVDASVDTESRVRFS